MPQGIKISLAGIATWIAAISSYNAIFSWADWPGGGTADHSFGDFVSLCIFPPLVVLLGFRLFSWALGEQFVSLITRNKSNFVPVILFLFLISAVSNSHDAASIASDAYDAAKDAAEKANDASYAANNASDNADSAARMASLAYDASNNAASEASNAKEEATNAALSCALR